MKIDLDKTGIIENLLRKAIMALFKIYARKILVYA